MAISARLRTHLFEWSRLTNVGVMCRIRLSPLSWQVVSHVSRALVSLNEKSPYNSFAWIIASHANSFVRLLVAHFRWDVLSLTDVAVHCRILVLTSESEDAVLVMWVSKYAKLATCFSIVPCKK